MVLFFSKHKTAYEMRISDWSSDVCSSDLDRVGQPLAGLRAGDDVARHALVGRRRLEAVCAGQVEQFDRAAIVERHPAGVTLDRDAGIIAHLLPRGGRSEEHTSELQSLMRISYAVICLKKEQREGIATQTLPRTRRRQ